NMFYEYERSNQKTRSRCEYEVNKVRQLESEKAELKSSLENIHDIKSALERNQLELQTEVTNLKFHLKQEQENRRNATMMYNTCQDKLRRMEEQHQLEVQERQNVELTLRNHELEMRTLLNNMKQVLLEDHIETQRQLAQERSTRALQESLLNNHLRRQQDIEEENQRNMSKSSENSLLNCFKSNVSLFWCKTSQLQVEDLSGQLEKEASRRSQLERLNEELKDQMASMTGRNYSNEQLERSKKQLEEEVLDLRRRVELAKVEHDQMEHYRRDAEEKARQEVQQKLEQVNLFLQTQAASQEALDRIKSANEVNLRSQLEQRIRELEEELSRAHSSQQDSLHQRESTRIELQRCHTLYADELRVRKSLELYNVKIKKKDQMMNITTTNCVCIFYYSHHQGLKSTQKVSLIQNRPCIRCDALIM
uniref:Uncharacterized protein n=1 Tax=Gouania willdenowi TaxID=441366 RepID=A0A8C5ELI6_GOUWI